MKTMRSIFVLAVLFGLVAVTVDRRVRRLRRGFEVRRLVEERAHLANEVAWLEGAVLERSLRPRLEARAAELGVPLGIRGGKEVVVPEPRRGIAGKDRS